MKECCLHMGCQLTRLLLLVEITAPEQTGQGQKGTNSSSIKILVMLQRNKKGKSSDRDQLKNIPKAGSYMA